MTVYDDSLSGLPTTVKRRRQRREVDRPDALLDHVPPDGEIEPLRQRRDDRAYATCQDQCAESEYAVACGGPSQPDAAYVNQQPPSGCRLALATPSGVAFYSCPCE